MRREVWVSNEPGVGMLLCFAGFAAFSRGLDEPEWPEVGEGEINVVFEVPGGAW
jgi:hypothetical protein